MNVIKYSKLLGASSFMSSAAAIVLRSHCPLFFFIIRLLVMS